MSLLPAIVFKLMRIKMKISYMAAIKLLSITELFIHGMIKSYRALHEPSNIEENMLWQEQIEE